jgi:hypothetical protein
MLQEYFWKNSDKSFFRLGHYSAQNKRNMKHLLDNLHLIDSIEVETKFTSFEMIFPFIILMFAKKHAHHYLNGQITYWNHMQI